MRDTLEREHPHVVVVDGMMLGSLRESLASGVPAAVIFHTWGRFWDQGMGNPLMRLALAPVGLSPLSLLKKAEARLLPSDRELDPAGHSRTRISFDWLGTIEPASPPLPTAPGRKLVLVSLSSAWQKQQHEVYQRIIDALAVLDDAYGEPIDVIVTTGGATLDKPLHGAPNVEIRDYADHGEIMPRASLVVGHGGYSTTIKDLAHGVPLLVLPLDPTSDQKLTARIVERAGVGRGISRSAPVDAITKAVLEMLTDTEMASRASRLGERLRDQDGARQGAKIVECIAA